MLDTDIGGHYVTDLDGNLLSLRQMREKYISGEKMMFYLGFGKGSSKKTDYYALVPEGFEPFRDIVYTITHDPDKFWE